MCFQCIDPKDMDVLEAWYATMQQYWRHVLRIRSQVRPCSGISPDDDGMFTIAARGRMDFSPKKYLKITLPSQTSCFSLRNVPQSDRPR
jgi:hypothetical protein